MFGFVRDGAGWADARSTVSGTMAPTVLREASFRKSLLSIDVLSILVQRILKNFIGL
jgi:hypothetical protein